MERQDLQAAASGGGYGHTSCPQGVPIEFALLSILAAFGVAFGILYTALTIITMGRRRRRRSDEGDFDLSFKIRDVLWSGEGSMMRAGGRRCSALFTF